MRKAIRSLTLSSLSLYCNNFAGGSRLSTQSTFNVSNLEDIEDELEDLDDWRLPVKRT